MKKNRLFVLLAGILLQQCLFGQELSIKEFMQLNPSVLYNSPEGQKESQGLKGPTGNSADYATEIKPKSSEAGISSAGPRYEKVRLLLPGVSKPEEYTVRIENGIVFLSDDIALFREEDFKLKKLEKGNYVTFTNLRWPGGRIAYTIPFDHPARSLILSAIEHINNNTNLCMVPRTTETNYVEFIDNESSCWSFVGMVGTGKQEINVVSACGFGGILHEILQLKNHCCQAHCCLTCLLVLL